MRNICPVCESGTSVLFRNIDGYDYFHCESCDSLHIEIEAIAKIDAGDTIRSYDAKYWAEELRSAKERAFSTSLTRVGECILYARRPVTAFLDVGTGPGYLLDAASNLLPLHRDMFHGIELFPPEERSRHPNYRVGDVGSLTGTYDAGVCIEVVEHLTPLMFRNLVRGLARISAPKSLWLFNTGMPDYVRDQDPEYLDPLRRGHIFSYGVPALNAIFSEFGFRFSVIPGKNYAFLAEYKSEENGWDFESRIYLPLVENKAVLKGAGLMYEAAFESARSSYYFDQYLARTRWAKSLDEELRRAVELYSESKSVIEALQHKLEAAQLACQEASHELAETKASYQQLLNSRSMAITRPLRKAATWWRAVRGH